MKFKQNIELKKLLKKKEYKNLIKKIKKKSTIEISNFLSKLPTNDLVRVIFLFNEKKQSNIFFKFKEKIQLNLYHAIDKIRFTKIFSNIPTSQRINFYKKLSNREQKKLLPFLNKNIKKNLITSNSYPIDTAGEIMNTNFCTTTNQMKVKEVIKKLREYLPFKKMIYFLYVVDKNMKMIGFIKLQDLILLKSNKKISNIMYNDFIYSDVFEDKEMVAQKIEKYNLFEIPILNKKKQLLGTISNNRALNVIRDEETEDMEKFMCIIPDKKNLNYLQETSLQHFKKRITWIIGLFIASFLSSFILHKNQNIFEELTILSLYITMIADIGGNVGSQAATVVIRALSLKQININNFFSIIFKETKIGILLSLCLFCLAFLKVILLSKNMELNNYNLYNIAFIIALSSGLQVITATLVGTSLPFLIKWFKGDPAVAASPAITTIVDTSGMLIYFTIIMIFLTKN